MKRLLTLSLLCLALLVGAVACTHPVTPSTLIPQTTPSAGELASPSEPSAFFAAGKGTEAEPYEIATASELRSFAASVNAGDTYAGKFVVLVSDIDLGGAEFTPIGSHLSAYPDQVRVFAGAFDGQGHTVKGLSVTKAEGTTAAIPCVGLFGYVTGRISHLTVSGTVSVSTSAPVYAGLVAGYLAGTASDLSVSGTAAAVSSAYTATVGGAIGQVAGTAERVLSHATVAATAKRSGDKSYAGGVAGRVLGTLRSALSTGTVTVRASVAYDAIAGAVIGECVGTVSALYYGEQSYIAGLGKPVTLADQTTEGFYFDTLGLSASLWTYVAGKYPTTESGDAALSVPTSAPSGSVGNPITVSNASGVKGMAKDKSYRLTANVTMSSTTPIPVFYGYFYGDGHTLSSMTASGNSAGYMGLFGVCFGSVDGLTISATVTASKGTGAIAGILAGALYGTATDCHTSGTVVNTAKYVNVAGGLVGENRGGLIEDCTSSAKIDSTGTLLVVYGGGLVAENAGIIRRSSASGTVSTVCTCQYPVSGGLVANNRGLVEDCFATGSATATAWGETGTAGGLVGQNPEGTVRTSYARGAVSATSYNGCAFAGSLVGDNRRGTVIGCFGAGSVKTNSAVEAGRCGGRLVGGIRDTGTVEQSYYLSSVRVTAECDTTTTSTVPANKIGESKSAAELYSAAFLEGLGWSADVWSFGSSTPPTFK